MKVLSLSLLLPILLFSGTACQDRRTLTTATPSESTIRIDTIRDTVFVKDNFVPWVNVTEITYPEECAEFFKLLETEWQRRPELLNPWQSPCYRWTSALENAFRQNTDCLKDLTRGEVLQIFGLPTRIKSNFIAYALSETCGDDFVNTGRVTVRMQFDPAYPSKVIGASIEQGEEAPMPELEINESVFVPWGDRSVLRSSENCLKLYNILEEEWKRRVDMPKDDQPPCYRWNKRLYETVKNSEPCLRALSRQEIMGVFGPPSIIGERTIQFGTSHACGSRFEGSGLVDLIFTFSAEDTMVVSDLKLDLNPIIFE